MSFHFVFPAFSIGLASYLAVLEGLWLRTSNTLYLDLFRYWVKIFAVVFGMGVVSGIVISYQFGTNWSAYSNRAGPIIGPLMAYEVLTAFFLEAGFLGVMLFGMTKVGKGLHFFATCMVAFGTLVSATWIISVNSWMQTPAGFAVAANGQFVGMRIEGGFGSGGFADRAQRQVGHTAGRDRRDVGNHALTINVEDRGLRERECQRGGQRDGRGTYQ